MAEFISTFMTGFQDVVAADLSARLDGVKVINVYDGLIHYKYTGNSRDLEKIIYFNNTFFVLKTADSKNQGSKNFDFNYLVNTLAQEKKYYLINNPIYIMILLNKINYFMEINY